MSITFKSKMVWLITGSNRGIGRAIAAHALQKGDSVLLGARDTDKVQDLLDQYPDKARAVRLDMNSSNDITASIPMCLKHFGRLDVLVNNAGYGLHGTIEEVSMDQVRNQMETNFFGLTHLTQLCIPVMRKQGSGYIVNISSIAGLRGSATFGLYNASKFAVNGLSEALVDEVRGFGIKVSVVEPGPYRTDWAGSSLKRSEAMANSDESSAYAERNQKMKSFFEARSGNQPGDPAQIAQVLFAASRAERPPLHMLFGDVAIQVWEQHLSRRQDPDYMSYYPHDKVTL